MHACMECEIFAPQKLVHCIIGIAAEQHSRESISTDILKVADHCMHMHGSLYLFNLVLYNTIDQTECCVLHMQEEFLREN